MVKTIKLVMDEQKSIEIYLNDTLKFSISVENRSFRADQMYDLLDYSPGDKYDVISVNSNCLDEQALDFFVNLFKDVTERVTALEIE